MDACAYCGAAAIHNDHVIPKSMFKKHRNLAALLGFDVDDAENLVRACGPCNWRKGQLRRCPPSWSEKVPYLNALLGGRPFKVWNGDPKELYA